MVAQGHQRAPADEAELIEQLSVPTPEVIETLASLDGDLVVLGAGGKIGPSLAGMAALALRESGSASSVIGVSRWSDEQARQAAEATGVRTISADLGDPDSYADLPDAGAVLFLAGQKFGTTGNESTTWWANAAVPALAAARYRGIRTVVYSSGNVYPLRPCAWAARPRPTRSVRSVSTRSRAWPGNKCSGTPPSAGRRRCVCTGSATPSNRATA